MSTFMWHITLDTGDVRRSARTEVDSEGVTAIGAHLERALAAPNGRDIIPTTQNILRASSAGANLVATVMSYDGLPIVTLGVARRSRGAGKLWAMLHNGHTTRTEVAEMPSAPWCAARIELPALVADVDWLGDYERLLAWAWIEGKTP